MTFSASCSTSSRTLSSSIRSSPRLSTWRSSTTSPTTSRRDSTTQRSVSSEMQSQMFPIINLIYLTSKPSSGFGRYDGVSGWEASLVRQKGRPHIQPQNIFKKFLFCRFNFDSCILSLLIVTVFFSEVG